MSVIAAPQAAPAGASLDRLPANATGVLAARLVVPAANLFLLIVLARTLGAEALGRYALLVTAFLVLDSLKSLGLATLVVREVAGRGTPALECGAGLVRIGVVGGVAAAPLLVAAAVLSAGASTRLVVAAVLMAAGLLPSAVVAANDAVFLGLGRAHASAWTAAAENAFRVGASVLAVVYLKGDIVALAGAYAAGRGLGACLGSALLRRQGLRLSGRNPRCERRMLAAAPSYLAIFALPVLLFRADVLLLARLHGDQAVGVYAAASRLVMAALIVPDSILTALFAVLSGAATDPEGGCLEALVLRASRIGGLVLAPVSLAGAMAAPWIVGLLYGPGFAASVRPLQILMCAPTLFALNRLLGDSLVAAGHAAVQARVIWMALLAGLPVVYALVRARAAEGAALAFVLAVALLLLLSLVQAVRLRVVRRPFPVLAGAAPLLVAAAAWSLVPPGPFRPAAASAAMAAALAPLAFGLRHSEKTPLS